MVNVTINQIKRALRRDEHGYTPCGFDKTGQPVAGYQVCRQDGELWVDATHFETIATRRIMVESYRIALRKAGYLVYDKDGGLIIRG